LIAATEDPLVENEVEVRKTSESHEIDSNGIPKHRVGRFPNRSNPNEIREQAYEVSIPSNPEAAPEITWLHGNPNEAGPPGGFRVFGITLDGVMMEPGTAEVWMGRRDSGWNYEALGGAVPLGLDANYGHVQPDGSYHYHGLPIGLMKRLGYRRGEHSPMIGWAADGFPVYALFGYRDPLDPGSGVAEMTTGYRLRQGKRPGGEEGPGGRYDGAFVQDYEHDPDDEDLDECNGRFCVTPEFPNGTYAYFLTRDWPVIPRAFRGTPTAIKDPGGLAGPDRDRPPFGFGGPGRPSPLPPPRRR
jgi:hypothetical protein